LLQGNCYIISAAIRKAGKEVQAIASKVSVAARIKRGVGGDFVVTEDELQPALSKLRTTGISVVAIHLHMTHEQPRVLSFQY